MLVMVKSGKPNMILNKHNYFAVKHNMYIKELLIESINLLLFIKWIICIIYMKCPCCSGEMIKEKETDKLIYLKCRDCGLSNSELKL